ncbi:Fur family transcriptional regulator [Thermoflexus sp.]|uniref:Fur family transcriptional regulator n=1 Tax=Thermoflexus sp. TaxID=1969742 RepID=UPI0035E40727
MYRRSERLKAMLKGLRESGLRLTPQRVAVCEVLAASRSHPTAYEIYRRLRRRFPTLSLATVYKTLDVLVRLGLVSALGDAGDGMVHYDGDTDPHINLVCLSCHRVQDLESMDVGDLYQQVVARSGYALRGARLVYYGLCPECQRKTQATAAEVN